MKSQPIKRIGKIGKRNVEANKILKEIFLEKGIVRCEVCGTDNFLSFAHRHKRDWYRSCPYLLSDYNQVLLLCVPCHATIEVSKEKTERLFETLRSCN